MKKQLVIALFIFTLAAAVAENSAAQSGGNKLRQASQTLKSFTRFQRKLQQRLSGLSAAQFAELLSRQQNLDDTDGDGLPDALEAESDDVCSSDSDNDGVLDGQEVSDGTDPNDDDSDDDGIGDGSEREVKGVITELTAAVIVVGGQTFTLTSSTRYIGRSDEALQASDFAAGECVEVEGHALGDGSFTANKVKKEDDCSAEGASSEVKAKGEISQIDAASLVVAGQTFSITAQTTWLSKKGAPAAASDFTVGTCVEVEGRGNSSGGVDAVKVEIDDDCSLN